MSSRSISGRKRDGIRTMDKIRPEPGQMTTHKAEFSRTWSALEAIARNARDRRIVDLFSSNGESCDRFERWSANCDDLLLDWSKTNIDQETRSLLFRLAECADVEGRREQMFAVPGTRQNFHGPGQRWRQLHGTRETGGSWISFPVTANRATDSNGGLRTVMTCCSTGRRRTSTRKRVHCCSGSRNVQTSRVGGSKCLPGSLSTIPTTGPRCIPR